MALTPTEVLRSRQNKQSRTHKSLCCDLCGSDMNLSICDQGHGKVFCHNCLKKTVNIVGNTRKFVAKCQSDECVFVRIKDD